MAKKEEFLKALDEHTTTLLSWMKEIGEQIQERSRAVRDLQMQRQAILEGYVTGLLPNLDDATIARLDVRLPNFVSTSEVEGLRAVETAALRERLEELCRQFDPGTSRQQEAELETVLAQQRTDLGGINATFTELLATPGLKELIDRHGGTDAYVKDPHHKVLGQFFDWLKSTQVDAMLHRGKWDEVLAEYQALLGRRERTAGVISQLQNQLSALQHNEAAYAQMNTLQGEGQEGIDEIILKRLHVMLKARLDNTDPAPDWMQDLVSVGGNITRLQSEINDHLQDKREKVSQQLTTLRKVRAVAMTSRNRQVPDEYLTTLRGASRTAPRDSVTGRAARGEMPYTPSVSAVHHIWVYDDDWIVPVALLEDMAGYFGHYSGDSADDDSGGYDSDDQLQPLGGDDSVTDDRYGSVS